MVRPLKQMTIILSILKRKYTYFQCKEMKSRSNRNTLYKYNKDISDATEKLNQFYAQFNLELDHVTLREKNDSVHKKKFRIDIEKSDTNKACNTTMLNNIGPKLKPKLVEIEEDICDGEVLYHESITKTPEEISIIREKSQNRKYSNFFY